MHTNFPENRFQVVLNGVSRYEEPLGDGARVQAFEQGSSAMPELIRGVDCRAAWSKFGQFAVTNAGE